MDDLISRAAAIDALESKTYRHTYLDQIVDIIKALPPVQPEIIRCKGCRWFNDIGCAIRIVDDTDKPSEEDYCSFAERRQDG